MLNRNAVVHRLYLINMLFRREISTQYVQNRLGLMWIVLNPLFVVLLYTYVFSVVLNIRHANDSGPYSYAVFLLTGMTPFLALNEVVQTASNCLFDKKTLLLKSIFPADVLPVVSVMQSIVGEFFTLAIVLGVALFEAKGDIKLIWLLVPLAVALRLLFSMAFAWWISILTVFLPDLRQVLGLAMSAWMFLTPILYPPETGPEKFRLLQNFNPLHIIVEAYRAIILRGTPPDTNTLMLWAVFFCFLNVSGYWLFKKLLPRAKDFL